MKTVISRRKLKKWMALREIENFEELAKKAGISPTTVYSVLDSYRFTGKTLDAIAKALEVHPFDLLEAEGYPDPHMEAPAFA